MKNLSRRVISHSKEWRRNSTASSIKYSNDKKHLAECWDHYVEDWRDKTKNIGESLSENLEKEKVK